MLHLCSCECLCRDRYNNNLHNDSIVHCIIMKTEFVKCISLSRGELNVLHTKEQHHFHCFTRLCYFKISMMIVAEDIELQF